MSEARPTGGALTSVELFAEHERYVDERLGSGARGYEVMIERTAVERYLAWLRGEIQQPPLDRAKVRLRQLPPTPGRRVQGAAGLMVAGVYGARSPCEFCEKTIVAGEWAVHYGVVSDRRSYDSGVFTVYAHLACGREEET